MTDPTVPPGPPDPGGRTPSIEPRDAGSIEPRDAGSIEPRDAGSFAPRDAGSFAPGDAAADGDDGPLMARLGAMLRETDPAPRDLVALAKESFVLRDLDAQLAELVEDSAAPDADRQPLAVRGSATVPQPRQLTFQVVDEDGRDEVLVAVQVEAVGEARRLTGHLFPQGPAGIEVRRPGAGPNRHVRADPRGLFVIDDVPPGPMSLTVRRPGTPPVTTRWTLV